MKIFKNIKSFFENMFGKDEGAGHDLPTDNTPRHGSRRLKTTARKGVAIYEKIKTPDSPATRHNGRAKGKAEAAKAKRSKK